MFLLDSNIIIYSVEQGYQYLRDYLFDHHLVVSKISFLEVLGYHKITEEEKANFHKLFEVFDQIPITDDIVDEAVKLRQARKISIGDSIIAATAIVKSATLLTANMKDFDRIEELKVVNPIKDLP